MVLGRGRVQDGTFAALKAVLSDEAILELTYAVATYGMHATICRALRLEYDDIDERVAEIAAPDGAATDVMSQISGVSRESQAAVHCELHHHQILSSMSSGRSS